MWDLRRAGLHQHSGGGEYHGCLVGQGKLGQRVYAAAFIAAPVPAPAAASAAGELGHAAGQLVWSLVTSGEKHVKFWDIVAPMGDAPVKRLSLEPTVRGSPGAQEEAAPTAHLAPAASSGDSADATAGARTATPEATPVELKGRAASIAEALRGATFIDVACGEARRVPAVATPGSSGSDGDNAGEAGVATAAAAAGESMRCDVFAVTRCGVLCCFDAGSATLVALTALEATCAYGLSLQPFATSYQPLSPAPGGGAASSSEARPAASPERRLLAAGCSDGLVRLFEADGLR